ncbi:TonB-dependent receptor, partial [bacterium]|nr:TonB-dependent receptor [bacterium]
ISQVTAGVHFRRDEYRGTDRLNDGQLSSRSLGYVFRNAVSGVGTVQISPKEYFQLTAQERIDAVEQTELEQETHTTGRLHFAITPLKASRWNLIFSGSYGSSYQMPSFVSLFLVESEFAMGNKELKPERGRDGDVGFLLRHHRKSNDLFPSFECSVNAFWNRIEDIIVWRRNFRGQYWPDNLAIGETKGVEFSGNISFFEDRLLFRGHATLQQPLNKTPEPHYMNKVLPLQPKTQGGASIETSVRTFEWSFGARIMGRRYTTEDNTDLLSTAQRDLQPFTVFDASLGWSKKLSFGKFAIRGRVENLLNDDYMIIERSPMPGRNYELQLSIEK